MRHQKDWINISVTTLIVLHCGHHFSRDAFASMRPGVKHLVVPLDIRNNAAFVQFFEFQHCFFSFSENFLLVFRRHEIISCE